MAKAASETVIRSVASMVRLRLRVRECRLDTRYRVGKRVVLLFGSTRAPLAFDFVGVVREPRAERAQVKLCFGHGVTTLSNKLSWPCSASCAAFLRRRVSVACTARIGAS